MDREQLRIALLELLHSEGHEEITVLTDHSQLMAEFGLDSMDMVSLIMRVEQQFRIRTTHDELSQITNVGGLLDLILHKIEANQLVATK